MQQGYNGWVLLFDEAELVGRLGKKARINAYANMAHLMAQNGKSPLEATFALFAIAASYREDVIEGKHEYANLADSTLDQATKDAAMKALDAIQNAPQLNPLRKEEIAVVLGRIRELHGLAYGWEPPTDAALSPAGADRGQLLRTRIRGAVERLDQLYQYGNAGNINVGELSGMSYEEEPPSLDGLVG